MRNRHERPIAPGRLEVLAQHFLDPAVRLVVHAGRRLVQQHQAALADQRAAQRQHLALAVGEVLAARVHGGRQGNALGGVVGVAVGGSVGGAVVVVVVGEGGDAAAVVQSLLEDPGGDEAGRVEVGLDGAVEEDGFLGDDGEAFAQAVAGDFGDVDAVVEDLARDDVREA